MSSWAWPLPSPDDYDYSDIGPTCRRHAEYALHVGDAGLGDVINMSGFFRGTEQTFLDLITDDPAFTPTEAPGGDNTPPAPASRLTAAPSDAAVTLDWTNPSDAGNLRVVVRYTTDGSFPAHPGAPKWLPFVPCHHCDPDGLGTRHQHRDWLRKRSDPELAPYLAVADPDLLTLLAAEGREPHEPGAVRPEGGRDRAIAGVESFIVISF